MEATMATFGDTISGATSSLFVVCFFSSAQLFFPKVAEYLKSLWSRLMNYLFEAIEITFDEYPDQGRFKRNEAYIAIEAYLSSKSTDQAARLKGELGKKSQSLVFGIDEHELVVDVFHGVKVKWFFSSITPQTKSISYYPATSKKFYILKFKRKHKNLVIDEYLKFVMKQGKQIEVQNKQRRLYTNNPSSNWWDYKSNLWSHVVFDHPATFETVAIDPKQKEDIINELVAFMEGKEYYAKIGRAWKRGYLLYGPPGTGKSSMIAAMANFLSYNVYDIELTSVKDNSELRKLLTDISSKSIIVIEDIDCSLDLTGQRKEKATLEEALLDLKVDKDDNDGDDKKSKVTLSGLLNFIDGLWSASGGERIIVFTTNHKDKLDPALIRRGRMDQHIELSYCRFEAFKVLAKNYLGIESNALFDEIKSLLEEIDMTPADVVEHIMPKSLGADVEGSLQNLIRALEIAKEKADRQKREEEGLTPKAEEEDSLIN